MITKFRLMKNKLANIQINLTQNEIQTVNLQLKNGIKHG